MKIPKLNSHFKFQLQLTLWELKCSSRGLSRVDNTYNRKKRNQSPKLFWSVNTGSALTDTRLPEPCTGRDTWCDKSLRHVAATGCCNKSPRVTCENHCRCDRILSQRQNRRMQPCRTVSTHLRQVAATKFKSTNEEAQLVSRNVKFELVYVSSLPKSMCTEKFLIAATCRRISADEGTCRRDVSQRFLASCVSVLKCCTNKFKVDVKLLFVSNLVSATKSCLVIISFTYQSLTKKHIHLAG